MFKRQSTVQVHNRDNAKQEEAALKISNRVITGALLISLLLVFGIMAFNFKRTYQNARNDVIELSKNSSAQNAERIEMFFTRHEDVLLAAAEIMDYGLSNEATDEETVRTLLYKLSNEYNKSIYKNYTREDFSGIYAAVNGTLIHAYKSAEDLPEGYNPTQRQWYKEGLEGGGRIVFGEPYYDVYAPDLKVMTATKLLSDGETVIGMDITLEDMQYAGGDMNVSVTLNGERHDYGHGFILTAQGIVIAHWDEREQGKNYNDIDSPMHDTFQKIKECVNGEKDYLETDIDGIQVGIFPRKLNNGWYVVTMTEFENIRTALSDFSRHTLVGTAAIILLGIIYCVFIFRIYHRAEKLAENLQGALVMAKSDALTNLGNRVAYDVRVRELKEKLKIDGSPFAIVMMDLNDLKYVNDHYGHAAGDQYIINCCDLVRSIFPCDIYRIGGDEFAAFLTDELFEQWEDLFNRLKHAVAVANRSLTPTVDNPSIAVGWAIYTGNDDVDALLRKADAEMYINKVAIKQARLEHSEKGYTEDLKLKLLDKQILVSEMRKGLDEEQFEVWFQPQVNHENSGSLIGAEALVRWKHPTRGMVSPAVFIPLFEYNGFIYELDKYVWKHACACIQRWIADGMSPLPISVNVSRLDIIQEDFIDTIISLVEEYQIPYNLLHLEITESSFSDDTGKVVEAVKELIERGFIIAIDDFGSGYSSLSLLRSVPAHIVKLDMRFFADGENQTRNECIIESIIRMVKMLGMAVLAEGVEYVEQADLLRALGCAYIQGYLYSKPLPYNDYVDYTKVTVNEIINRSNTVTCRMDSEAVQSQKLFYKIISGTSDVIIVSDNKTRQLLYANRAAEQFFGKRFDPLNPTTCMEYCDKGEMCMNCPAQDMQQGERREFVSSENGVHLKSLYAQMDWNGHDAVVLYQTDISAQMREMEFANSLMNSLGVGIVVFRGDKPDELKQVSYNKEFMRLSGFDREAISKLLVKDCLYGVHPDDIAQARAKFVEAFHTGHPMRHYLRVKKAQDKYEWVSVFANIKHIEDNSFEAYMIFADAEEEMRKLAIDNERYEKHITQASKDVAKALSIIHLNISKNTCHSIHRDISVNRPAIFEDGFDGFIFSVVNNIAKEDIRAEFMRRFSRATLKEDFERGFFTDELRIPIRLVDQRIIWCNQTVNISKNPITGDLEAVMSLTEADKAIRLEEHYKRLLNIDYEFVGDIDVETGLLTVISEPNSRGLANIGPGAVPYMENLVSRMTELVAGEAVDACIEAMSLNVICDRLKTQDVYTCTFPAREELRGNVDVFQWRFCYVDTARTEMLFSRRELKDYHEFMAN